MRLRTLALLTLLSAVFSSSALSLQWSVGVMAGEPTGGSAKFWLSDRRAIDVNAGYSWSNRVRISSDFLFHWRLDDGFNWRLVFGLGPEFSMANGPFVASGMGTAIGFGARIPFGAEWRPTRLPFAIFAEISPGIGILPAPAFVPEGYLGIRASFEETR